VLTCGGATLEEAFLVEAELKDADLTGANLQSANLRNTDLKHTTGLQSGMIAQANVSNADLPSDVAAFEGLDRVREVSQYARRLFSILLAACAYSLLTIATTTDAELLTNEATSQLPIIGTTIPIVGFYWAAPLAMFVVYVYFHLQLQRLWEELAALPSVFPSGEDLDSKADPWLLLGLARNYVSFLEDEYRPFFAFQKLVVVVVAWWAVPLLIALFGYRHLPKHHLPGTIFHVVLTLAAAALAVSFYRNAAATLRGNERASFRWANIMRDRRTAEILILIFSGIVSIGLLSYGMDKGYFTADLEEANMRNSNLRQARLEGANLRNAQLQSSDLWAADLTGADLASANLDSANLRYATLIGADLFGASLRGAYLEEARLDTADMGGSSLSGAHAEDARMSGVNLGGSILQDADFTGAILDTADLEDANLSEANLTSTRFFDATMTNTDLSGVNLLLANLRKAFLNDANLSQALLVGSNLNDASFTGANLQGADFYGAPQISDDIRQTPRSNRDSLSAFMSGAAFSYADLRNIEVRTDSLCQVLTLDDARLDKATLSSICTSCSDIPFSSAESRCRSSSR